MRNKYKMTHWAIKRPLRVFLPLVLALPPLALPLVALLQMALPQMAQAQHNFKTQPAAGAYITLKRKPKNDLENINKIGRRKITGIINEFSLQDDYTMGFRSARSMYRAEGVVTDPMVSAYIQRLGQKMARHSDIQFPLEIHAIPNLDFNAWALPGGFTGINTGMILFAQSEDELAGVIGHEIAHVAGRHSTRQISQKLLISAFAGAAVAGLVAATGDPRHWGVELAYIAAGIAMPLAFFKFSRKFEEKSDILGVQYAYKAGYDPLPSMRLWQRVHQRGGSDYSLKSSHPPSEKRARTIHKYVSEVLPDRQHCKPVNDAEFRRVQARVAQLHGLSAPTYKAVNDCPPAVRPLTPQVKTQIKFINKPPEANQPPTTNKASEVNKPSEISKPIATNKPSTPSRPPVRQKTLTNKPSNQQKTSVKPNTVSQQLPEQFLDDVVERLIENQTSKPQQSPSPNTSNTSKPPAQSTSSRSPKTSLNSSINSRSKPEAVNKAIHTTASPSRPAGSKSVTTDTSQLSTSKKQTTPQSMIDPTQIAWQHWQQDYKTGLLLYYDKATDTHWWHSPKTLEYWYAKTNAKNKTKWR